MRPKRRQQVRLRLRQVMTITTTQTVIVIIIIIIVTVDPGGIVRIMIDDAMTIPIDGDDVPDMTMMAGVVTAMDDVWMATIDARMDHLPTTGINPTHPRIVAWGILAIHHREFQDRLQEIQDIHDVDHLLDTERNVTYRYRVLPFLAPVDFLASILSRGQGGHHLFHEIL